MFGLGMGELIVILIILILVFGASRLPELGKGLGQGMRGFRDALKGEEPKNPTQSGQNSSNTSNSDNKPV